MTAVVDIRGLRKVYKGGFEALKGIDLQIEEGEILALLGPNGAGKTTLISTICGITDPTSGQVLVSGHDWRRAYRQARGLIGLVPQEINLEGFDKVINSVRFSRGLFGMKSDDAHIEKVLKQLSLWEKRDARVRELSGGMKRRVLIAKALSHEPRILFLDEPTAGVDVALRKGMWDTVSQLKADGVTIILTTHYIEEAEALADRVGVIRDGQLLLVEEKQRLMERMGEKQLTIELTDPIDAIPPGLEKFELELSPDGRSVSYVYDTRRERTGITSLLSGLSENGIVLRDLKTSQSSLEDIFVGLVEDGGKPGKGAGKQEDAA